MRQNQLDGIVTFIVVAEEQSFSAAAVRLGISPSAISQSIRTLEQRLGVTLLNRTTRSVAERLNQSTSGFPCGKAAAKSRPD